MIEVSSSSWLLNHFHPELASLAGQAEELLWTNPRAMLIQGRLFAERLAKIVAQESKVEPVYEIRQADRLHLLERKGVIDADIRASFEWLRMNGNAAAHEAKEVPLDIALTAHRHIYQLSAWFTEAYGPLDVQVPEYAMPEPPAARREDELSADQLSAVFQRLIEDHVSGKLLSSIEKKFQEIRQALDKVAGSVEEWARVKGTAGTDESPADGAAAASPQADQEARAAKPADSDTEPAAPAAKPAASDAEPAARAAKPAASKAESAAPASEPSPPGPADPGSVVVPPEIAARRLEDYRPGRLSEVSREMGIATFGEWTEERLKELYRRQPKALHDILVQLWFFGVDFRGELGRFIRLDRASGDERKLRLEPGIDLKEKLPLDVARMLERFGIRRSEQLNGVPYASLEWLLRGRYGDTVEILDRMTPGGGQAAETLTLLFQGETLDIPPHMLDAEITGIPIRGCPALIDRMVNQLNCVRLRDLPQDLSELAERIRGVGTGMVRKFFRQLRDHVSSASDIGGPDAASPESADRPADRTGNRNDAQPVGQPGGQAGEPTDDQTGARIADQTARESGRMVWRNRVIELEPGDMDFELEEQLFPSTKALIRQLIGQGRTRIGDLPANLWKLLALKSVGEKAVDRFLDQLERNLANWRFGLKQEREWRAMTVEERIAFAIGKIEADWADRLSDEELSKNRNLRIVHLRWLERREGRKATLEWLGQQFGLTRERIRQIIRNVLGKFHPDVKLLVQALAEAGEHRRYFRYEIDIHGKFAHGLIEQVVEEFEGLTYLEQYGWWTVEKLEDFERKAGRLKASFTEWMRGNLAAAAEIREKVAELADGLPSELAMRIIEPELRPTPDRKFYFLAGSKKYEIAEMVLRQYPEGVEVYKRAPELCERANRIMPGAFEKERDLTSIFSREEFADTAYLWGRGTYIHRSFVREDAALVREIADKGAELLEVRSPISVGRLFSMYEDRLMRSGIPNEYALYTMLRKHAPDKLAPNKFPHIWHKDDAFQLSNAELIKVWLRERREPQTTEALREEFVARRGWKEFTLNFSINTDPDFVRVDYGVVGLREFYPFREDDFEPVLRRLRELLAVTGVIHANRLLESARDHCERMGVRTPYLLYDLLKGLEIEGFRFARYPLITSDDHPLEGLTLLTIVEQFIEEQEAEVPREMVFQWVTEEIGARDSTLDNALSQSVNIFYYRGGQFGEYIHRNRLEWTPDKEEALAAHVRECLERARQRGRRYVTIGDLRVPDLLPPLPGALEWTEDLLSDCIRKSGRFGLIGSMDWIVVSLEDSRVRDGADLIAHVLETDFGGEAGLKALQRRLAEIRYSKDGSFLAETTARLESGDAPFVVEREQVKLRQSIG